MLWNAEKTPYFTSYPVPWYDGCAGKTENVSGGGTKKLKDRRARCILCGSCIKAHQLHHLTQHLVNLHIHALEWEDRPLEWRRKAREQYEDAVEKRVNNVPPPVDLDG